ncbi:MAG: CHAT domain-containing protein [Tolypothrix brevis GSE-NOS-MK-07-07A]|nr:CHAT domain-containing protein [Tolypothrix brevis GSE-NOS-MK-07-07A]
MFQASGTSSSDVSKRTILLLAANPLGTSRLCLGEEERDIRTELQRTRYCNWFDLQSRWAVRYSDVQTALHEITPQIVHFSGHGEGQDGLVFQDENGRAKLINSEALANLFQLCAEHVECVVLNACFSDVQAREIALHIPYVIGMKSAIGDRAAREFSIGFYKALGFGKPYSRACEWGRNAIQLAVLLCHSTLRKTWLLFLQLVVYLVYESGVSILTMFFSVLFPQQK